MKRVLVWMVLSCSGMLPLSAAEPAKPKPSSSKKSTAAQTPAKTTGKTASAPAPASTPASTATTTTAATAVPERKLEPFLLLPMPKLLGTANAKAVGGSVTTVFCPAREIAAPPYIEVYTDDDFAKLGISIDAFEKKARQAAERLLTVYRPELIKDDAGRVRYGVYRGEKPIFACLMMAPSLGKVFQNVFGKEVIVAMPDRNALYVFPPNTAVVDDFAGDLEFRYESALSAASDEVFIIKADNGEISALGSFAGR
jgi:hypothetical protein